MVPPGSRFGAATGLRVRHTAVPAPDLALRHGFRCTTGLRTALDIARLEPLLIAVPALDVLLEARVVGRAELEEAAAAQAAVRGARRCRRAVSLADPRAESQPESRVRVILALAGLVAVPQHVVRDGHGRFVARVDLAFPEQRVAIEYDGAWHGAAGHLRRDRRRLNRLMTAGWTVLHVTAADLHEPTALVAQVRAVLVARETRRSGV